VSASPLLSSREQQVLALVGRFRFLTSWHVQSLLFNGVRMTPASKEVIARRTMKALVDARLLQRVARPMGGVAGGSSPHVYCLSVRGASLLASDESSLPKRKVPRGTFLLRHALSTADFVIGLQDSAARNSAHRLVEWSCDWETAERVGSKDLIPDASFIYQSRSMELHAFVEIDLGTMNSKEFAAKIGRYLDLFSAGTWRERLQVWPTVLTLAPDPARALLLKRATEALLQHRGGGLAEATEFAFAVQADACLDPVGRVWITAGATDRSSLFPQGDESE